MSIALAPGTGWVALFEYDNSNGTKRQNPIPVTVWESTDTQTVGYIIDKGKLRAAEPFLNFKGYAPASDFEDHEYEPWDQKRYEDHWLEIELSTGRRFEARRDPDIDDLGVLSFELRDGKAICVRPSAIIAVTFLDPDTTATEGSATTPPPA